MEEVYEFLKKCNTYYLATVDGDKPKVRPFGTINIFENKLYIQTGKIKNVSKQIKINPNIELCAFNDGTWIRVEAMAIEDDRIQAKEKMLEAYPELKSRYDAKDGNTQVFYLKNVIATFESFVQEKKTLAFANEKIMPK